VPTLDWRKVECPHCWKNRIQQLMRPDTFVLHICSVCHHALSDADLAPFIGLSINDNPACPDCIFNDGQRAHAYTEADRIPEMGRIK